MAARIFAGVTIAASFAVMALTVLDASFESVPLLWGMALALATVGVVGAKVGRTWISVLAAAASIGFLALLTFLAIAFSDLCIGSC